MGCHFFLQRMFLTQGLNPHLLHCRQSPALEVDALLIESFPEFPVVTRESWHNSRKTTGFPRHCEMRPFPAAAYQGKSHVPSSNSKRYLTHLLQLIKFPKYISHSRGTPSFPAHLNLSPFSPSDLDMRVDSPALSGKGSRPSCRTSGGGRSHLET